MEHVRRAIEHARPQILYRTERHQKPVARERHWPHAPAGPIVGRDRHSEFVEEMPREAFDLHVGEVESQAHVRATAEGNESELVPVARSLTVKARRVIALRVAPKLRHVVSKERI